MMRLLGRLRAALGAPAPAPTAGGWPTPGPAPDHPPLTEAEVAEAEAELGIRFPPAYRAYLTEVSSGGRVHRLARGPAGWWWEGNGDTRRDLLPVPFPHPDSYAAEDDELWARMPQRADFPDDAAHQAALRAWDEDEAHYEFEERKTAGAVVLQENGCGFSTLLALTGPLADTVWWDGRATCDLIVPLSFDHPRGAPPLTFREWREMGLTDPSRLLGPDWGAPADF
ncbi:SMI1/KNR4 family protein [Streptomyces sp. NPDC058874]|uniref:SMI1/KNR4 family protein n=1 Tax=unclassified Streptomyces TaxID=2593676 RepID=UPI0036B878EE